MSIANIFSFNAYKAKRDGAYYGDPDSSKGYPRHRDPMAVNPVGIIMPDAGEGELRSWKNRYAPNEPG